MGDKDGLHNVHTNMIVFELGHALVHADLHCLFNVVETMVTSGRPGGRFIGPAQFENRGHNMVHVT